MLYLINGKVFIKASGYYKEVIVKKNPKERNDFLVEIVKGGERIEAKHDEMRPIITIRDAFRMTNGKEKSLEKDFDMN